MLIALDGIKIPISLHDCDALLSPLAAVLGSWRFRVVKSAASAPGHPPAPISVTRASKIYRIASPWLDEPVDERSEVGAVFSLTAELARAFAEETPGRLCFHCAAVEADGRLIMFPSSEEAGKSTLAAKLASLGLRLFADDVLAVSETACEGVALGIAPRLRLPLPAAELKFRAFVEAHCGPRDDEFLYLALPASLLAPHGERAPIGAAVLLDRRRSARTQLAPLPRGQGLRRLIVQNFAPGGTSITTLDRLHGLIERLPCFALIYSDLDEAAGFLRDRFSATRAPWRSAGHDEAVADGNAEIAVEIRSDPTRPRGARFEQVPGVMLRAVDDDIFLVKSGDAAVFHLNPVAASLWRLLERPTTMPAAIDALCEAFPRADARRVRRDVRILFDTLQDGGLIRAMPRKRAGRGAPSQRKRRSASA